MPPEHATCPSAEIDEAYSADRIASGQPVRKPFRHNGELWVCTSITGSGLTDSGDMEFEAYRIVPARLFADAPTTYGAKINTGELADAARCDPNGFYHGVAVKHGRETFVLRGPPLKLVPGEAAARPDADPRVPARPVQLGLF